VIIRAARPDRRGPPLEKRIPWASLPGALKESISARTGPVTSGRAVTDGQNSPLAAVLETRDGKVFVKGLPSHHRLVITQAREAAAAPLVKGISPELLWQFDEAGWNVLGFEHIDGRSADYRPGSPDTGMVTDLMQALSAIEVPSGPGPWKPIETRLRTNVQRGSPSPLFPTIIGHLRSSRTTDTNIAQPGLHTIGIQ